MLRVKAFIQRVFGSLEKSRKMTSPEMIYMCRLFYRVQMHAKH